MTSKFQVCLTKRSKACPTTFEHPTTNLIDRDTIHESGRMVAKLLGRFNDCGGPGAARGGDRGTHFRETPRFTILIVHGQFFPCCSARRSCSKPAPANPLDQRRQDTFAAPFRAWMAKSSRWRRRLDRRAFSWRRQLRATVGQSDRAHITDGSFLGITSVTDPDGSQRAVEVHVFPEAMRGTGEGSYDWDGRVFMGAAK